MSVKFGNTVPGSKPHKPFMILHNIHNGILRQAIFGGIMFKITGKRLSRCRKERRKAKKKRHKIAKGILEIMSDYMSVARRIVNLLLLDGMLRNHCIFIMEIKNSKGRTKLAKKHHFQQLSVRSYGCTQQ
jgi:hypothetical protein